MTKNILVILALILGLLLIIGVYFLKQTIQGEDLTEIPSDMPELGAPGTEHSHMTMLVYINGELFDFSRAQFQLPQTKNFRIHMEDGDGTTLHKHATGVTLPLFFTTFGGLTAECFTLPGQNYCTGAANTLKIFINRRIANDIIDKYELQKNDKIMINYGNDSPFELELKLNSVPDLGPDL